MTHKPIINFETDNMYVRSIEETDKEAYMGECLCLPFLTTLRD